MACHISVRDIDFHPSDTGVRIRVTTDVPSHLFVRLSLKEPWVHMKPSIRRGVAFAEDVRFCFTVFEDNEQNEWGDTLEHTWWKENWPPCTTKWLYVWGMVAGEVCVSTTAPFKYHNTGIEPVPTWGLIFHEPWSIIFPPPLELQLLFLEPWTEEGLRLELKFYEPWTS
ncbi:hypothetical protein ES705_29890 [subsurface metagenome]